MCLRRASDSPWRRVSIGSRQAGLVRAGKQFGQAHGGAAGVGGQQALTMVGKKQGVDEFGLAARELGDKGHHQLIGAGSCGIRQPQGALGVDAC
jgi:hypothetical protein